MDTETLLEELDKIAEIPDHIWMSGLEVRKRKELEFHDRDRDKDVIESLDKDTYEKFYANRKYYRTTAKSTAYVQDWIARNAKDKVFLDYACGNGANAIRAAQAGARLSIGIDISRVSVLNAAEEAKRLELTNTIFVQTDAESTLLPKDSVDVVICSGMLHHLDLSYAFPELRRILAPGGSILAVEALDYNPAIKLYRRLTPDMRTDWEKRHILSLKDVKFASRFFDVGEVRFWHITSYAGAFFPRTLPLLNALDGVLTKMPGIKLMAWMFTFEMHSKENLSSV